MRFAAGSGFLTHSCIKNSMKLLAMTSHRCQMVKSLFSPQGNAKGQRGRSPLLRHRLLSFNHLLRVVLYALGYIAYLTYGLQNLFASLLLLFHRV